MTDFPLRPPSHRRCWPPIHSRNRRRRLLASTPRLSIAVLPISNRSSDAETEYFSEGMTDELMNALAKVEGLRVVSRTSIAGSAEPSSHYLAMLGCGYAKAGRKTEAVKILKDLETKATKDLASAFDVASLHAALSEKEQALAWLEQGYAKRDYRLVEIRAWPWFDSLRADPRFQTLLRRMRLPA